MRTIDASDGRPPEVRELRGSPAALAGTLREDADLGFAHLQVQLRPNTTEAVAAFGPVIEALTAAG